MPEEHYNEHHNNNQNFIEGLRNNWVLIAFAASIVITWANFSSRVSLLETQYATLAQDNKQQTEQITKINTDLGGAIIEIKANYLFIKEKLEKLDKSN